MNQNHILQNTSAMIKKQLESDPTGHDWQHIVRVCKMALRIAHEEKNGDLFLIELASLLHEIGDYKITAVTQTMEELVTDWLTSQSATPDTVSRVIEIIQNVSFSKNYGSEQNISIEAQIVQDADRLDAIGAIGIARTFAYGGAKHRIMYDPEIKPVVYTSTEQRRSSNGPTVNHFYEKLLLLRDLMNTNSAQKIAHDRHEYMKRYLKQFFDEWEGIK